MTQQTDTYWAQTEPEEFLNHIHEKIGNYYDDLQNVGIYYAMETSFRAYYGANLTGGRGNGQLFDAVNLGHRGKQGEVTTLKLNHFRNLLRHMLQLTTSQRPAFSARATNSDYKSQVQATLADGLLDFYMKEKKLEQYLSQAVENALVFGEGFIFAPWSPDAGEPYAVGPDGEVIHEGDQQFHVMTPMEVIRDTTLQNNDQDDWVAVKTFSCKYDLAEKFPEFREEILSESQAENDYEHYDSFNLQIRAGNVPDSDRIPVWYFYHRKNNVMRSGRSVIFIGSKVLFDSDLEYESIPVFSISPDKLIFTNYGYSPAFDLLAGQEALDLLGSTIMSNNAAFGIQHLWTKKGDDLSAEELSGGLNHLQSHEEPRPLQLTRTAPETFKFRQEVIQDLEVLSGISSVTRGQPEASLKSGAALAMMASSSVQFASLLEGSFNNLVEDVGTALIQNLRKFSRTPRVVNIIGVNSRPFRKEFVSDDLQSVNRVVVERVNPMSKTIAGRMELAESLMKEGFIKSGREYINILNTGQLDSATDGDAHRMLGIQAENEALREGEEVIGIVSDIHSQHIERHLELLSAPESRSDPELVQRVLAHVSEHMSLWRSADPAILMITGQDMPPPAEMSQQGPPPQQHKAPQPPQGAPKVIAPGGPVAEEQMPSMPNMPKLPDEAPPEAQAAYEQAINPPQQGN